MTSNINGVINQAGFSVAFVFILFCASFLVSPYYRSQFDYSRSAWQRLLLSGGAWLFVAFVTILAIKSSVPPIKAWLTNLYPTGYPYAQELYGYIKLLSLPIAGLTDSLFTVEWIKKHPILYSTIIFALTYRLYYVIFRWYLLRFVYLIQKDMHAYAGRNNDYDALISTIIKPSRGAKVTELRLRLNATNTLKELKYQLVPFQWVQPLVKKIDEVKKESDGQITISLDALSLFFLSLTLKRASRKQKNEKWRSRWMKLLTWLKRPFVEQRIENIAQLAWDNSEDLHYQLYKSQEVKSTRLAYINKHEVKAVEIQDHNSQPGLVSIHMTNGRIYVGWVVNSTKPGMANSGITLLPYLTRVRDVDSANIKNVTDYEAVIWGTVRDRIVSQMISAVDVTVDVINKTARTLDESTISQYSDFKAWLDTEYRQLLFKSDGITFEVSALFMYFPEDAEKFYKSLKLENIELIHPYDPAIEDIEFTHPDTYTSAS